MSCNDCGAPDDQGCRRGCASLAVAVADALVRKVDREIRGVRLGYAIRNKEGLYARGKSYPSFSKQGKIWSTLGHLKSHLRLFESRGKIKHPYAGCEVVVFEIAPDSTRPIEDLVDEMNKRK